MSDDPISAALAREACPQCDGRLFQEGPRAGSWTMNVRCIRCGSTFYVNRGGIMPAGRTYQPPDLFHGPPAPLGALWKRGLN